MEALISLPDADALRAHLDALNEKGIEYRAAGEDANGEPFLITLRGPYAEYEEVFYVSPWDGEVDHQNGEKCEDCCAANPYTIDQISYPVRVLVPPLAREGEAVS